MNFFSWIILDRIIWPEIWNKSISSIGGNSVPRIKLLMCWFCWNSFFSGRKFLLQMRSIPLSRNFYFGFSGGFLLLVVVVVFLKSNDGEKKKKVFLLPGSKVWGQIGIWQSCHCSREFFGAVMVSGFVTSLLSTGSLGFSVMIN